MAHIQLRLARAYLRLGLCHRLPEPLRVHREQQVALAHFLVVPHRDLRHRARNIGGNADHVRAHAAVAGPG
ncbi:hypothetical protein D3C72_1980980 [compost metagenome]